MIEYTNMIRSFLAKTIAILLLLAVLVGIGFLIIYPKQTEIEVFAAEIDTEKIANNTMLKFLTRISKPIDEQTLLELNSEFSMENITPEQMAKYKNEGKVLATMEPMNAELQSLRRRLEARFRRRKLAYTDEGDMAFSAF